MDILPSALCCRIRVPLFIRIRTIRKSGYFGSVFELRPVSRCQESSRRSCCNSRSKSICSRGSANPGSRFSASMPSPGWQVLRFVAMMKTFLLCISVAPMCKPRNLNHEAHSACRKARETLEDHDRRYVAAKLVNIAQRLIDLTMRHSAKTLRRACCDIRSQESLRAFWNGKERSIHLSCRAMLSSCEELFERIQKRSLLCFITVRSLLLPAASDCSLFQENAIGPPLTLKVRAATC